MNTQEYLDYDRIAKAISFIRENFKSQPDLNEIAENIHLSSFHFQRMFRKWAGVSPKKFLQYLSVDHAKKMLDDSTATLADAAYETGLSGTGRLHDLFITIEGMTPGTYKNGGKNLTVCYSYAATPFGDVLVASTEKGICHIAFVEDRREDLGQLVSKFPNALFVNETTAMHRDALSVLSGEMQHLPRIKLHVKGTGFQIKVWEALLKIPKGKLTTYSAVASAVNNPKALRAVGTAVGNNPVAYLIPCHRVIQASGALGQYRWGATRKAAITGWEAARLSA